MSQWSSEEDERLRLLYEVWAGEVIPIQRIADALGRTPGAVRYRASKLGLTDPHRPRAARGREAQVATRICGHCGNEFDLRRPSDTQKNCSRSCAAKARSSRTGGRGRFPGSARAKVGRRADLGDLFFRSSWEANYARYLNHLRAAGEISSWEYEPQPFFFPVKRGNKGYLPDFRVWFPDGRYEWHEVKGYMDKASVIKLRRFALHWPAESAVLRLIDREVYYRIRDEFGPLLEGWEQ